MRVEYRLAVEASRIAGELIPKWHEHLIGVRIEYVFRSTAQKNRGRVILGSARKVTGLNAWLASDDADAEVLVDPEAFFVIELAEDEWNGLKERQRVALVDHELSHCFAELDDGGRLKLSTKPHDLEEFAEIVRRHGLWKSDVRHFVRVGADQLAADGGDS